MKNLIKCFCSSQAGRKKVKNIKSQLENLQSKLAQQDSSLNKNMQILNETINNIDSLNTKKENQIHIKEAFVNEQLSKLKQSIDEQKTSTENISGYFFQKSQQRNKNFIEFIPKNFVIKVLNFPPTKSRVLLLGIENRNQYHASFLADLLNTLEYDIITTQISPDQPYFIKTDDSYQVAWKSFIQGNLSYKFLASTNPNFLADVTLNTTRIQYLMEGAILKSTNQFEIGSQFAYSKNYSSNMMEVDNLLTPLLYSHNNSEKKLSVVLNDLPILNYREQVVRQIDMKVLKDLFVQFITERGKMNSNFDVSLLEPQIFLAPKIGYMSEIIKQTCYISKNVISVVDYNCTEMIEEWWKNSQKEIIPLQRFMQNDSLQNQIGFVEYIEKHVLLDLMFGNYINRNFIQFQSFPYSALNTIGRESYIRNVFIIWQHYHDQYRKNIKNIDINLDIVGGNKFHVYNVDENNQKV